MDRTNVIAPTIRQVGMTLGQKQHVACSLDGNRPKQSQRRAIEKRLDHRSYAEVIARLNAACTVSCAKYRRPTSKARLPNARRRGGSAAKRCTTSVSPAVPSTSTTSATPEFSRAQRTAEQYAGP